MRRASKKLHGSCANVNYGCAISTASQPLEQLEVATMKSKHSTRSLSRFLTLGLLSVPMLVAGGCGGEQNGPGNGANLTGGSSTCTGTDCVATGGDANGTGGATTGT